MSTYLRFCGVYSFLFFLSLLGFHTHLISDKTKINNCLFPRGQVFSLDIRLTRLTIPRSAVSFKEEALSFLSGFSEQHYFGIWVSFISPNYVSSLSDEKTATLHVSPPLTTKWQLIMRLHPVMNKWQLTCLRSLKIHHVLALGGCFFHGTNHSRRFASPLTHTWLIEGEVLPCSYHHVIIERSKERDGLCFHYSSYNYSRWRSESRTPFSHNPANVLGCHISSSQG